MADNWFTRTLNRNANWLGIESVTAAPDATSGNVLGGLLGNITGFVSGFTRSASDVIAKTAPDSGSGGFLKSFTNTLGGFSPLLIVGAIGAGLYLLLKKR